MYTRLENTGAASIELLPGAIKFTVNATVDRSLERGFMTSTNVVASMSYVTSGSLGEGSSGLVKYEYTDSIYDSLRKSDVTNELTGNASARFNFADAARLDGVISSGAIRIDPGEWIGIGFVFSIASTAGGEGACALVDAGHTAIASLSLPHGTEIHSATPLRWISAVPETPIWLGMISGLAVTMRLIRRRDSS
jgi:hypothetical protein